MALPRIHIQGREPRVSPPRKSAGPRGSRRSHVPHRHGPATAPAGSPAVPPGTPPLAEAARVPIRFEDHEIGELRVTAGTDEVLLARALRQLALPPEWAQLGAKLAALGPHRLSIAARAATAAAGGGRGVTAEEAERIACWFGGVVDEAVRRGGLPAAVAIWTVLAGDSHADPAGVRVARCPAVAEVPPPPRGFAFEPFEPFEPGEPGEGPGESGEPGEGPLDPDEVTAFLAGLRAAAPGYVHTAIACASEDDLRDLREITVAGERALEELRPWGVELGAEAPAAEALEDARSMLTYRRLSSAEACSGFADWAHGFAGMVAEHSLPPVLRIGAIAWLARVALRTEGPEGEAAAASASIPLGGDAARDAARPAGEAARGHDRAPQVCSLARHGIALESAGWHVIEVRPSATDALALWRVTIERYDRTMTMTLRDAISPDDAIEELLRYTQADAG